MYRTALKVILVLVLYIFNFIFLVWSWYKDERKSRMQNDWFLSRFLSFGCARDSSKNLKRDVSSIHSNKKIHTFSGQKNFSITCSKPGTPLEKDAIMSVFFGISTKIPGSVFFYQILNVISTE